LIARKKSSAGVISMTQVSLDTKDHGNRYFFN
jgi:hypothetical protein